MGVPLNSAIKIRAEKSDDHDAVKDLNDRAFNQSQEGIIVGKITNSGASILSLVAEIDKKIVGHILFSPAQFEEFPGITGGMGLAPMAVLPGYQEQGIGKMLVKEGISILRKQNVPFIIVLGHEHYYPKFGFEKASGYGIRCQWEGVPDEAFMILILNHELMSGVQGVARYMDEFNEAM